jgi:hypothetical protein
MLTNLTHETFRSNFRSIQVSKEPFAAGVACDGIIHPSQVQRAEVLTLSQGVEQFSPPPLRV